MDAYKAAYVQMTVEVLSCLALQADLTILFLAAEAVEVAETFKKVRFLVLHSLRLVNDVLNIFSGQTLIF